MESLPFFGGSESLEDLDRFARNLVDGLRPGGKLAFFPWMLLSRDTQYRYKLKDMEEIWEEMDMLITTKSYTVGELKEIMSARERELAETYSVLFQEHHLDDERLEIIFIEKTAEEPDTSSLVAA